MSKRLLVIVGAFVLAVLIGAMPAKKVDAHSWTAECTINLDNDFGTTNVYRNARASFTEETKIGTGGVLTRCDANADDWQNCWSWRERCGSRGYINYWPLGSYSHFHMFFDNPTIDVLANDGNPVCFCSNGDGFGAGYGFRVNGTCSNSCPNWGVENRNVVTAHDASAWVKIWYEDTSTHQPRVFDVPYIQISDTPGWNDATGTWDPAVPMELWFQKTDGSWWFWPSLAPTGSGWSWDISGDANDMIQMQFKSAAGAGSPTQLLGLVIRG
jgi:hypothetical protein